jgi:Lrp/AsnC family transcriptional regulator for asnA, asnC and gidA
VCSILELDKTDRHILNLLQDDARRSFKQIANEVNVSEATVFFRVKKLLKNGVIRSFKAIVDPKLIGKETLAFVMLKVNPNVYTKILPILMEMTEIYEIYDVTGAYYAILKIRTKSTEELATIIDKIGMIEGITGTETAVVLRSIKEELSIKT